MPQLIKDDLDLGQVLHEWGFQEYEHYERGKSWYVFMAIIGLFLVFYAIFTGNFLFAVIIVLFSIILFLQNHQNPAKVLFQITNTGIVVGTRFFSYSEFEGFYLIYNPPEVKTLFLETKSFWQPLLRIPLLDQNPIEIKHSLREFLPEHSEKEDEPLSDRIGRSWRIH